MRPGTPTSGAGLLLAFWFSWGLSGQVAQAQTPAARCTAVTGALMTPAAKNSWARLDAKSDIAADALLIAFFGAEFHSPNGAVNARLVADVGQRGPFPVLEAAIRFHVNPKVDLDVTLERGILILTNTKKTGSAHVRVYLREEPFEVTLNEPNASLVIEVYGRHVPGPPHLSDPKLDDPVANIAFFAVEGEAVVAKPTSSIRLHAPPGQALLLWDNVTRMGHPVRFEKLPESAKPMSVEERKQFEAISGFAKSWAVKPSDIGTALERAVFSKEAAERKAAVVALGALDDLSRLMRVLNNKDHADTRDMAILVLRHWLGREPGQSIRLYEHLTKIETYTPIQAKNFIYLCNGLEAEKRRQPATYDLLIRALDHGKMPMRELARWHLVRLAPDGKSIAYDAAHAAEQRREAILAWRRLIPDGELPPAPKQGSSPK